MCVLHTPAEGSIKALSPRKKDWFITNLMQSLSQNSFLKWSSLSWTWPVSSERAIKAGSLKKKAWGYSDLKLFCSSAVCATFPINYHIGDVVNRKKKNDAIKRLTPPLLWLTETKCPRWADWPPIGVYWSRLSLYEPHWGHLSCPDMSCSALISWTSVRAWPTSELPAIWLWYHLLLLFTGFRPVFFGWDQDVIKPTLVLWGKGYKQKATHSF